MTSYNFLVSTILLSLIGCSAGVDKKDVNNVRTSSLFADKVNIISKNTLRASSAIDSLIESKQYTLQACLKEGSGKKVLAYQNAIAKTNGQEVKTKTDQNGCLTWDINPKYDYQNKNTCRLYSTQILLTDSSYSTKVNYSVDINTDQFSDRRYSQGCKNNVDHLERKDDHNGLVFTKLIMKYDSNPKNQRSDTKHLHYNISYSACIKHELSSAKIKNTPVKVEIFNKETKAKHTMLRNTDHDGCINWKYGTKFEQHKYSHWMDNQFKVTTLDNKNLNNASVSRQVFINPWEGRSDLFFIDSTKSYPDENKLKQNSRFHLDGVMYILVGNDVQNFQVDPYLGLTMKKTYQVVLKPRIDRIQLFTEGAPQREWVKDGKFKLSFMLLSPKEGDIEIDQNNFTNFKFITGAQKTVEIRGGVINSLINLPIKITDIPKLATRALSVFKLEPLEDIGLRPVIVTGYFKAKLPWIKTNVMPADALTYTAKDHIRNMSTKLSETDRNIMEGKLDDGKFNKIEDIVTTGLFSKEEVQDFREKIDFKDYVESLFISLDEKIKQSSKDFPFERTPKQIFVEHLKKVNPDFKINTVKNDEDIRLTAQDFSDIFKDQKNPVYSEKVIEKICKAAFPSKKEIASFSSYAITKAHPQYKPCLKEPSKFFHIKPYRHLVKLKESKPDYSSRWNVGISARISDGTGKSYDRYFSIRHGMDGAMKMPLGDFFTLGFRLFDISYSQSWRNYTRSSHDQSIGANKNLIVEKYKIDLKGTFDQCLLINGKEYNHIPNNSNYLPEVVKVRTPLNHYICGGEKNESLSENWYFVRPNFPRALLTDTEGPTEIDLMKIMRGYSSYQKLETALRDETKEFVLQDLRKNYSLDDHIFDAWGHLLDGNFTPEETSENLSRFTEGSFPGTIE